MSLSSAGSWSLSCHLVIALPLKLVSRQGAFPQVITAQGCRDSHRAPGALQKVSALYFQGAALHSGGGGSGCKSLAPGSWTHPSSASFPHPTTVLSLGAEWMEEQTHLDIWDGKGDEVPVLRGDGNCSLSKQLT